MFKTVIRRFLSLISLMAILCLCDTDIKAQSVKDSAISFPIIGIQYSFDVPAFDLAKSFGVNSTIGASYYRKTASNWLFGIEYNYIFGDVVKINPLDSISTSQGFIVNNVGQFQELSVYERGHLIMLKVGKIFKNTGHNPNSGLFVKAAAGFWLHQIFYYWTGNAPPQLSDKYLNGYDRLSYGPALSQSFGYLNFSNSKVFNLSAELEVAEGVTYNQRAFDYDVRQKDNSAHFDMTIGIKVSWYFPLYNKVAATYYY